MREISLEDIIRIDNELISEGCLIHQRPMSATLKLIGSYNIIEKDNILEEEILKMYNILYPSQRFNFPSLLIGGLAFRDQFYVVRIPMIYGRIGVNIYDLIDIKRSELEIIYKYYPEEYQQAIYCICDLYDIAYGIDDLSNQKVSDKSHWLRKISSNIRATAFNLSESIDLDSVIQTSLLSVELMAKYCLTIRGYTEEQLKKIGHNKEKIINALYNENIITNQFSEIYQSLPNYVDSRYDDNQVNKLYLVNFAIKSQFLVAEIVRCLSNRNFAYMMHLEFKRPAFRY